MTVLGGTAHPMYPIGQRRTAGFGDELPLLPGINERLSIGDLGDIGTDGGDRIGPRWL